MPPNPEPCPPDRYELVCAPAFARLFKWLEKIDTYFRGDDQAPGLLDRVRVLEAAERRRQRLVWLAIGAAVTSSVGAAIVAIVVLAQKPF